jgi:hypothetical protein
MKRFASALVGLAAIATMTLAGCGGSTKLLNTWTDPTFQTNSLKKIMVLGVARNASVRRMFEDRFVAEFTAEGVQAVPSYSVTGDGAIDSTVIVNALMSSGCDGIIITRMTDRKTVETYYPPTTSYVGAPSAYYGGYYGYYSMGYSYTSSPGYTVQNEVVNLETNLYRVADSKLVWSGLSQSWLEQAADPSTEIIPFVQQLVYGLSTSKVVVKVKPAKK